MVMERTQSFEMAAKGIRTQALSIESLAFYGRAIKLCTNTGMV